MLTCLSPLRLWRAPLLLSVATVVLVTPLYSGWARGTGGSALLDPGVPQSHAGVWDTWSGVAAPVEVGGGGGRTSLAPGSPVARVRLRGGARVSAAWGALAWVSAGS